MRAGSTGVRGGPPDAAPSGGHHTHPGRSRRPNPGATEGQYPTRRRDDRRPHQPRSCVTFVLDNSVAMRWCFESAAHPYADSILQKLATGDDAIVPVLWFYEASAYWPVPRTGEHWPRRKPT